ncbi:MAG: hypothetical protein SFV81_19280 [Pirellulaceae bacterium]|nr:hypothetical protein [Pirellulaceae bacterium]
MRKLNRTLLVLALAVNVSGCSILNDSLSPTSLLRHVTELNAEQATVANAATEKNKVANPPARTIRFDGHEIVLGDAESQVMDTGKLVELLEPLVTAGRFQSAATIVERHRESTERLLAERWATSTDDPVVKLAANVLSKRSSKPEASWTSLLKYAKEQPNSAKNYLELRNAFAIEMQTSDPSNDKATQLQQAAQKVGHPLVRIDALRLLGLRELVAERNAWAESLCRQAVDVANKAGNPLLAAELLLMVAESARRSDQDKLAVEAWTIAVNTHLASIKKEQPIDVGFWLLAEHIRPEAMTWPADLADALGTHATAIGCSLEGGVEMLLWACIAQAQFDRGEMQMALVNFKKAETLGDGDNVMWLRIAQSKCLAGMGQAPAAAAILSSPAASSNTTIAAAATAAMGSIKLQAGAYQQGAQLLHKALTQSAASEWPTKNQAMSDLALAQLIIGDTEPGLAALHAVQNQFEKSGEKLLLVQSLENELRLLEHENRDSEVTAIKSRIAQLERL